MSPARKSEFTGFEGLFQSAEASAEQKLESNRKALLKAAVLVASGERVTIESLGPYLGGGFAIDALEETAERWVSGKREVGMSDEDIRSQASGALNRIEMAQDQRREKLLGNTPPRRRGRRP